MVTGFAMLVAGSEESNPPPRNFGGNNLEPEKILDLKYLLKRWFAGPFDAFEPGRAYPLSEVEKIRADLRFIPPPTRDELFINGKLD